MLWKELELVYAENVGLRRTVGIVCVAVLALATFRRVSQNTI